MNNIVPFFLHIVKNFPGWVWVIFIYLFIVGMKATKERTVTVFQLFLMPLALMLLKWKFFVTASVVMLCNYGILFLFSCLVGYSVAQKIHITVLKHAQSIKLPGSYHTLILFMIFFLIKCVFGYVHATNVEYVQKYMIFEISINALFSGYLLGRVICYVHKFYKKE